LGSTLLSKEFSKLNPGHKLFRTLAERNPIWWQNLVKNPDTYIDIRKDNYVDVYHNGGRVMELKLSSTGELHGKIHVEYIPLESQNEYVPLELTDDSVHLKDDSIGVIGLDSFSPSVLKAIHKRMEKFYPSSSEKGIQSSFVLTNTQFLDTEFQYADIRFDLIWVDLHRRKLFVVELKTIRDPRLYFNEQSNDNKINTQLNKYSCFIHENALNLLSHYEQVLAVKRDLGILRGELGEQDSLEGFAFEEKPILLIGDCTQLWIDQNSKRLDASLKGIAYGCFYQGANTRQFVIPEKSQGNRHVFAPVVGAI
jgi:hypothetical protein